MTFFLHFLLKKKLGEWTSMQWSKVTLLFSLTCSVDFFMLSPHSKPAFLALIPPFVTSLNSFVTFFRPLQPPILAVTTGESMKFPGSTPMLSVIYRKCSHANKPCTRNQVDSEWVKKISVRSWVELHFTTISYILSFNYSYWYEINLIRIMYTANSSILYSKEKTVCPDTGHLRYSKQIEFQEELINFLRTWLL